METSKTLVNNYNEGLITVMAVKTLPLIIQNIIVYVFFSFMVRSGFLFLSCVPVVLRTAKFRLQLECPPTYLWDPASKVTGMQDYDLVSLFLSLLPKLFLQVCYVSFSHSLWWKLPLCSVKKKKQLRIECQSLQK